MEIGVKEIEAQVQKCRALQNAILQARPCSTFAKTHWHAMPGPNLENPKNFEAATRTLDVTTIAWKHMSGPLSSG